MSNDDYTIEKHSVNLQPFVQEPVQKVQETVHKPLASGKNYTITTNKPNAFSFSLSQDLIDYGKFVATNPVIRDLHVTATSLGSYQLLAAQDHQLRTQNNLIIPDTTCDNGSCSEITTAPWVNTLTYGFGYHTDSMNEDRYKQLADSSRNELLQTIAQGMNAQNQQTKLTFKVNVSGTQKAGAYSNTITIIATPDY